jgi:DNA-binding NarL/FixJ family response regulator
MSKKTILIVEDEPTISFNFKIYCDLVINELPKNEFGIIDDINVVVADNLNAARQLFQSGNVFLISLDLNLNDDKKGKEVSGMVFLRELRERGEHTMVLVASSESDISNSTEATQKLKAIGYYIKSELNQQTYQKAIEAVILYQNAIDLLSEFDKTGDPEMIDAAQKSIKKVKQAAEIADLNYGNFPEDLEVKLMEKYNKLDRITKLPSNEWIEQVLRRHIVRKSEWTMIKIEVLNLNLIEKRSASQVTPLLHYLGGQLREIPVKFRYKDAFVGNYQINHRPIFLVIVFHNAKADYPAISKWV